MKGIAKYLILTQNNLKERFLNVAQKAGIDSSLVVFATTSLELDELVNAHGILPFLISFSTSVIVPAKYLFYPEQIAVNVHAASPDYPGRDPHHYAIYDEAKEYGATLHYMTEKVDEGSIISVELFKVEKNYTPNELMLRADENAWILIEKLFQWLSKGEKLPILDRKWSTIKRTRKDFKKYCKIDSDIEEHELNRRVKAFHVEGYNNLYTEIHGVKFFYKPY